MYLYSNSCMFSSATKIQSAFSLTEKKMKISVDVVEHQHRASRQVKMYKFYTHGLFLSNSAL